MSTFSVDGQGVAVEIDAETRAIGEWMACVVAERLKPGMGPMIVRPEAAAAFARSAGQVWCGSIRTGEPWDWSAYIYPRSDGSAIIRLNDSSNCQVWEGVLRAA